MAVQADDRQMIEHIHALQEEVIRTAARHADAENNARALKQRIEVWDFVRFNYGFATMQNIDLSRVFRKSSSMCALRG
jgi:hypothetical protein